MLIQTSRLSLLYPTCHLKLFLTQNLPLPRNQVPQTLAKPVTLTSPSHPSLSPAPPPSHDSFYGLRKLTFLCPRRFFFSDCVSSNEWMPLAKRPTFAVWPAHSVGIPSENEANGQTHTHTHACKSMHKHGCDRK